MNSPSTKKTICPPGFLTRFATVKCAHGQLPHWEHPGVAAFVTLRLGDSLPQGKIQEWQNLLEEWKTSHSDPWDDETEKAFSRFQRQTMEQWLDNGYGAAIFSIDANREIAEQALHFYDGKRYTLYSYVVMPNHIHLLMMPNAGETISSIISSLKHFISARLSNAKSWNGKFWQTEYWDTLIRNVQHFNSVRSYIRSNCCTIAYDVYREA